MSAVMTKRSSLKIDTPYYETSSQNYFFTPDGIGVIWGDRDEIEESMYMDKLIVIDKLLDY